MSFLGARYPIIQAPMAFVQPPSLAAVVSNAGAIGSIAGAGLSPDELGAAIRLVRAATDEPFAVNLFAPPFMRPGQLEVVLEESGVNVVVAQGLEAGGHRGTFLGSFEDALVPLDELVASIDVSVPVVAAGGIVDGAGVRRVLDLGAAGAQIGTAFLFTPECGTPREHVEALRTLDTVVTPAYTGRHMRAARTPLLEELMAGPPPLPYPEQRAAVAERGPLFMGGTSARRARELPAAELVETLAAEARL